MKKQKKMCKPAKYDSKQDTLQHKDNVAKAMQEIVDVLTLRSIHHDDSKLEPFEKKYFDKYSQKLKAMVFGSKEYKASLQELDVAIKHHYLNNRHHPEHYKNGVEGMGIFDLLELLADWKAASLRTKDGSFRQSFDVCCKRFKIEGQKQEMLRMTAEEMGWLP